MNENEIMDTVVTNEVADVAEEVVTNDNSFLTKSLKSVGVAAGVIAAYEGAKWIFKKIKKTVADRKAKKQEPDKGDTESLEGVVEDIEKEYPIEK